MSVVEHATVFIFGFVEFVKAHLDTGSDVHSSLKRDSQKEHIITLSKDGHHTFGCAPSAPADATSAWSVA